MQPIFVFGSGEVHGSQTITTSSTFTVPSGVTLLTTIEGWGGGAGGGDGDSGGSGVGGNGGGAGGYFLKNNVSVTPGQMISVIVGTGGNGTTPSGTCLTGGSGGTTTLTIGALTLTANSGIGGGSCGESTTGTGGTATGGDTNTTGGAGAAHNGQNGSAGGNSPNGGAGGAQVATDVIGNNGIAPGGGGSGGGKRAAGGNGARGQVTFTW